jgi:hypothetical protein
MVDQYVYLPPPSQKPATAGNTAPDMMNYQEPVRDHYAHRRQPRPAAPRPATSRRIQHPATAGLDIMSMGMNLNNHSMDVIRSVEGVVPNHPAGKKKRGRNNIDLIAVPKFRLPKGW